MRGSLSDGFEGKKERESGSMKNRTQQLPFAVSEAEKPLQGSFRGGKRRRETADEKRL